MPKENRGLIYLNASVEGSLVSRTVWDRPSNYCLHQKSCIQEVQEVGTSNTTAPTFKSLLTNSFQRAKETVRTVSVAQHPHKSWACNPNTAKEDIIDESLGTFWPANLPKMAHSRFSEREKNGKIDTNRQK